METIGHKIYNARRKKGFSQERLADEAGISLRTLQRMEKSENLRHIARDY
jgi:transcriptional regulator with XRE-family HTH domain